MTTDIDYTNFKNAVHGDPERDRALMKIWAAMHDLQMAKLRSDTEPPLGFHTFFPDLDDAE